MSDDTLARILPHIPKQVQKGLLGSHNLKTTLERVPAGDTPIHLAPEAVPSGKPLPVDEAVTLARRCAEPAVLDLLAEDRRVSVREALAKNPHLGQAAATRLLSSVTAEADGPERWETVAALVERLIISAGAGQLEERLDMLATYSRTHGAAPRAAARQLIRSLTEGELAGLLADRRMVRLFGLSPLGILALACEHPSTDSLPGQDTVLAALRAEKAETVTYHLPRGMRTVLNLVPRAVRSESVSDEELVHFVTVLRGFRGGEAGHLIATHYPSVPFERKERFAAQISVDTELLRDIAVSAEAAGAPFVIDRPFAGSILRYGGSLREAVRDIIPHAAWLTVSDDACELAVSAGDSIGADLITLVDQLSANPHAQLHQRLCRIEILQVAGLDDMYSSGSDVHASVQLIRARSRGDGSAAAELLEQLSDGLGDSWSGRRRSSQVAAALISTGVVPLADLAACEGGPDILKEAVGSPLWAEQGRIVAGELASVPEARRIGMLAVTLAAHVDGDSHLLSKLRPWVRQQKLFAEAALRSGRVVDILSGPLRNMIGESGERAVVAACLENGRADRAAQVEELVSALVRRVMAGDMPAWLDDVAAGVTVPEFRRRGLYGVGAAEAALLAAKLGEDVSAWQAALALIDTWEGTFEDLAHTAQAVA